MRALACLVILLGAVQDDELTRRFADEDPTVRAQAEAQLSAMGSKALPILQQLVGSRDADVRDRATRLLRAIEEVELAMADFRADRAKPMRLATIDAVDQPLGDVIAQIEKNTGRTFYGGRDVDQLRRITLKLESAPFGEAEEKLGLPDPYGGRRIAVDGVTFHFLLERWPSGTVFVTKGIEHLVGRLSWDVSAIKRGDESLPLQRCGIHSPAKVLVPIQDLKGARVVISATRTWNYYKTLMFKSPKQGERKRAGPFLIQVDWPRLVVLSDQPVRKGILEAALHESCVTIHYSDSDRNLKTVCSLGSWGIGGGGGKYGGRADLAWCGCIGRPKTAERIEESRIEWDRRYEIVVSGNPDALPSVESIEIRFHPTIEERFAVTSPPLE